MKMSAVAGCHFRTRGTASAMPADGPSPGNTPTTMPHSVPASMAARFCHWKTKATTSKRFTRGRLEQGHAHDPLEEHPDRRGDADRDGGVAPERVTRAEEKRESEEEEQHAEQESADESQSGRDDDDPAGPRDPPYRDALSLNPSPPEVLDQSEDDHDEREERDELGEM